MNKYARRFAAKQAQQRRNVSQEPKFQQGSYKISTTTGPAGNAQLDLMFHEICDQLDFAEIEETADQDGNKWIHINDLAVVNSNNLARVPFSPQGPPPPPQIPNLQPPPPPHLPDLQPPPLESPSLPAPANRRVSTARLKEASLPLFLTVVSKNLAVGVKLPTEPVLPPGALALTLISLFVQKRARERIFGQIVADMREECALARDRQSHLKAWFNGHLAIVNTAIETAPKWLKWLFGLAATAVLASLAK